MLKIELHAHTGDDPVDVIPYTTFELIDHAAALGYDALAITLHEHQLDLRRFLPYAAERGVVLIPGVERTVEGRHVLLLNYKSGAEDVRSFADLAALKRRASGLVIAPHPFFPTRTCLRGDMERHVDLFDAVERNAMFIRGVDFNRAAERFAARHGKPVVGNCDVHRLVAARHHLFPRRRGAGSGRDLRRDRRGPRARRKPADLLGRCCPADVGAALRPVS